MTWGQLAVEPANVERTAVTPGLHGFCDPRIALDSSSALVENTPSRLGIGPSVLQLTINQVYEDPVYEGYGESFREGVAMVAVDPSLWIGPSSGTVLTDSDQVAGVYRSI